MYGMWRLRMERGYRAQRLCRVSHSRLRASHTRCVAYFQAAAQDMSHKGRAVGAVLSTRMSHQVELIEAVRPTNPFLHRVRTIRAVLPTNPLSHSGSNVKAVLPTTSYLIRVGL
eukprot:2319355-Rhodomonas_salina.2